jgi:Fur family peroxide stress response transcriptional regulator
MIIVIIISFYLRDRMVITNRGRKHSRQRDAILTAIQSTRSHPSAQWVYEKLKPRMPGLSLGTVYRNISLFREEGLVRSLGVVNGEERFDGFVSPHPHCICSRCGRVADIPCPDSGTGLGKALEGFLPAAGDGEGSGGFIIDYRETVFYGLCGDCAKSENCGVCR